MTHADRKTKRRYGISRYGIACGIGAGLGMGIAMFLARMEYFGEHWFLGYVLTGCFITFVLSTILIWLLRKFDEQGM